MKVSIDDFTRVIKFPKAIGKLEIVFQPLH